jgi:hypothetical protein
MCVAVDSFNAATATTDIEVSSSSTSTSSTSSTSNAVCATKTASLALLAIPCDGYHHLERQYGQLLPWLCTQQQSVKTTISSAIM